MTQLLILLALQAVTPPPAPPVPPAPEPCHLDLDRANATLALGLAAFDQDMSGGWRALAQQPGCEGVAADMLYAYRSNLESHLSILYWHEGQLRANIGQIPAAIRLMEQSRKADDRYGWNPYVDATVAFLRGDRAALVAARAALAALPRPDGFRDEVLANGLRVTWPQNLAVVDGLVRCFGRPYREAYGSPECRAPTEVQRTSR
jgi:hypothetical protein